MESYAPADWNPAVAAAMSPWTAGDPMMYEDWPMTGPAPMPGPAPLPGGSAWGDTYGPGAGPTLGFGPGGGAAGAGPVRGAVRFPGAAAYANVPDIQTGWHLPGWRSRQVPNIQATGMLPAIQGMARWPRMGGGVRPY